MQEMGIRHACNRLHIEVKKVAHTGTNLHCKHSRSKACCSKNPDATIVLPVNDVKIRGVIRRIVQSKTKLIFLSNFPRGIPQGSYVTYVGDNDLDSGRIVGLSAQRPYEQGAAAVMGKS